MSDDETIVAGESMTQNPLEALAQEVGQIIREDSKHTARSQQSRQFRVGISDLGHCRNYTKLMIEGIEQTDERDASAAWIGTALGEAIEQALAKRHPDWKFQITVNLALPGGYNIPGHPDIVGDRLVADLKSKNGLASVQKYGQTQQQRFQLHALAAACLQEGIFEDNGEPIWVGDIFYDRSGVDNEPLAVMEQYDPLVLEEITDWLEDVAYAVRNGEDASRDKPREWCWEYCELATACRGHDTDVTGLIEDPEILGAINDYVEGGELERRGKRLKAVASMRLQKAPDGSTGDHTLRHVVVNGGEVSYYRQPYTKLDIRAVRKPKSKEESA